MTNVSVYARRAIAAGALLLPVWVSAGAVTAGAPLGAPAAGGPSPTVVAAVSDTAVRVDGRLPTGYVAVGTARADGVRRGAADGGGRERAGAQDKAPPETAALMLAGLLGIGLLAHRRRPRD